MVDLRELKERVGKATGPDRELDAELCATFRFYDGTAAADQKWAREWPGEWRAIQGLVHLMGDHGSGGNFIPAKLTSSIDAALGLVERKLPDHAVYSLTNATVDRKYLDVRRFKGWQCGLAPVGHSFADDPLAAASKITPAHAPTAPLAILTALLSALETTEPTHV